jgi:uncharacterized protein (DUF924 family)
MIGFGEILQFWFEEADEQQWWKKDAASDQLIRDRYSDVYRRAASGELFDWRKQAPGWLAEIIVLDQFPRNMFRGDARSFATDNMAVVLSQEAVANGVDRDLQAVQKSFLYMPLMHSESALIHETAVELFSQPELEHNLEFELKHKAIIDRFGRYPHRNEILGRESTPEELEFLAGPGSSF